MPKTKKKRNTERTSPNVATVAGQLLNGRAVDDAVLWLQRKADAIDTELREREHAITLLGVLDSVKRVAASALTQR
jgi:hypothetical protein